MYVHDICTSVPMISHGQGQEEEDDAYKVPVRRHFGRRPDELVPFPRQRRTRRRRARAKMRSPASCDLSFEYDGNDVYIYI